MRLAEALCITSSRFRLGLFAVLFLASVLPAAAQLSPVQPDPLARIRDAAKGNTQACSATGETLCEQVAPKIIANAQRDSPLTENIFHLNDLTEAIGNERDGASAMAREVAWGVAAFRDAAIDVHTEKYTTPNGGPAEQENVVAEIRGREKPDEWVLVGARLDSFRHFPGAVGDNCDAAMLIEAARDIMSTGVRPRRSIRFVLFTATSPSTSASWGYVRSHRAELDRARAAILLGSRCKQVTGYQLNGRQDIEAGVREAMKPIESLGASHYDFGAALPVDAFDFVLEGVPTITAYLVPSKDPIDVPRPFVTTIDKTEITDPERDTAIVAVTAFGIAERAEPIGPRQSRVEVESLLKITGLEQQMKTTGLWPPWESGERGHLP